MKEIYTLFSEKPIPSLEQGSVLLVQEVTHTNDTTIIKVKRTAEQNQRKREIIFSEQQKRDIREKYKNGASMYQLAEEYNCSRNPIRKIIYSEQPIPQNVKRNKNSHSKYDSEKIEAILNERTAGVTFQRLAEKYGGTPQGIKYICDKYLKDKEDTL